MTIDRIRPTRAPSETPSGDQNWRELFFLHWSYAPEAIAPHLPSGMTLDLWEGRALVGVVPFLMRDVRPSWLPRPLAMDFLETNLRTYVIVNDEPGVLFFSLEASSWLAVRAARTGWGLPQGLRKNNRCIRPRGSPALVVARRSLAPGKLPPRA